MDADGTDAEQLTTSMGNDQSPDFSPDGTRIAFESDRDGNRELYFMAGDGTGQTRLTTDAAADDQPAWSPSGTQIAWTTERDGDPEIYTMDVDVPPTNLVNISNAPSAVDDEPDWFAVSVPGAPQAVVAFGGPAQAMVTWSPPLAYGGSSITVYSATASPGDATCVWSSGPLQCTVMGLTNETMYSFTVTATNATGTGPASAPSSVVTPQAKPHKTGWPGWVDGDGPRRDLPDIFVTTEGEQAAVSFPAASSVPEDPVVGYEVTAQPGGQSASGAGPPITVTGLEPGVAYRFVVQATTAAGATATLGPSEEVLVGDPRSGAGPSADATDCAGTATSRHADLRAPGRAAGSLGLLVLGVGARHRREAVTSRVARRRARAGRARLTALAVTAGGMVALVAALTSQAADLSLC
jgi:hypothetical protein